MVDSRSIGNLNSVSVREIWPNETMDFTPWLSENLELLGNVLGLDLELIGSEVPVGSFSADLLLVETNSQLRVIVENQFETTDHDHLGKTLTWASGLNAAYAVWIAETFRDEHLSALRWLNKNSEESISYFGIELKVWRIGDSQPAPQLNVVVEPDEWLRKVAAAIPTASVSQKSYRNFWSNFIADSHETFEYWSRTPKPTTLHYQDFPARKKGLHYSVNFCRRDSGPGFRIELYVDGVNEEEASQRFAQLMSNKLRIEEKFGDELHWEELKNRRAHRIALYYPLEIIVQDSEKWDDVQNWTRKNLRSFRDALQPYVDQLT